jgi:hypothetical protein
LGNFGRLFNKCLAAVVLFWSGQTHFLLTFPTAVSAFSGFRNSKLFTSPLPNVRLFYHPLRTDIKWSKFWCIDISDIFDKLTKILMYNTPSWLNQPIETKYDQENLHNILKK